MTITEKTTLKLKFGNFETCYHRSKNGECVSFSFGDIKNKIPLVRIHSACLFGETFLSKHCDCQQQLHGTFKSIIQNGSGVIVYAFQEGRGIGLEKKIKAMELQRLKNVNTVEAFKMLDLPPDLREYSAQIDALKDLELNKNIILVSNNPAKINTLKKAGYKIRKIIKLKIKLNKDIKNELLAKKNHMGYYID